MEAHGFPFSKIIDIDQGAREHYHVPKYQREYTWSKPQWEKLLQDIDENDLGYFMGSIICVKDRDFFVHRDELIYEVVDGQQRLTTLSLLMMAIYKRLSELKGNVSFEENEDQQDFVNTITSLKNKLVKKKKDFREGEPGGFIEAKWMCFCRVQPSSQNHNLEDYLFILSELGLINKRPRPHYCTLRTMYKAFDHFQRNIPNDADSLLSLVSKINQLKFVYISVGSQADAFTLFETLNNRGVPLSAIDIIKNKMLSEMERQHQTDIDESYDMWQEIIRALPDTGVQERFLRHFYNTFKVNENIRIEGVTRATKSNIIIIYENLIKRGAQSIFEQLRSKAKIYSQMINRDLIDEPKIVSSLTDMAYIGAAPAYQVLLYIFSLDSQCFTESDFKQKAIDLLSKYHVRRNVTDIPPTRDLDQLHIDLIEKLHRKVQSEEKLTIDFFEQELLAGKGKPAPLEKFSNSLENGLYASNPWMSRYLLIKLDSLYHTREYNPDLWARDDKGRLIWTVEHIFPQNDKISPEWIQMIGDGDKQTAEEVHEKYVHCLGNLTLSGYNSALSTASFSKKQELYKDRTFLGHKINIGYRNGLALNNLNFTIDGQVMNLATAPTWRKEMIISRTKVMTDMLVDLYKFRDE